MGGSPIFTFLNYLKYRSKAVGVHSLHSPFVYKLFNEIVKRSSQFRIQEIEDFRKALKKNQMVLDVTDFKTNSTKRSTISVIAKSSLSTPKFSAFLYLLANELQSKTILETGTSLGVNALYLDHSSAQKVITLEASPILAELARKAFKENSKNDLILEFGDIHQTFIPILERYQPDFIFLDADHRGSVVKTQVEQIITHSHQTECIVIHDIYWSKDMNDAWNDLKDDNRFKLSIDIFHAGILFPSKGIEKQHFTLRF